MFRWTGPGALICILAMTISCGGTQAEIELGNMPPSPSDSPRVTSMKFLGQSPRASDILIFEIAFDDTDGDVGAGKLLTFINQETTPFGDSSLKTTFLQSELDPKSKKGLLRIVTQVAFLSPVQPGQQSTIEIAFQLKDAKGHASNTARARLLIEFQTPRGSSDA